MKFLFFIISAFILSIFLYTPVFAAEIFFGVQSQKVGLGKLFEVKVFIDTENESVNAAAGKIKFSSETLELKEIKEGNSIINFWIEKPEAKGEEVIFSGITPGGYVSRSGYLFSLILKTKKTGEAVIAAAEEQIFLNDGQGSKAVAKQAPLFLRIEEKVPDGDFSLPSDSEPPEAFSPEIGRDANLFDNKWFLVFATQDKGSGISYYKVCEGSETRCATAESPYLLQNQKLNQKIFVKAIDKSGNERMAIVEPRYPMKWYEFWWIWGIIILGVFLFYIVKKYERKNTRKYTK